VLLAYAGDIFGVLALVLISATALLMLVRKRLLRRTRNLELLRRIHIIVSALGGLFLILHVAYFVTYPISDGVLLGYVSSAVALIVWVTGTAFLERFRDSLFFHGSLSLAAISLMLMHAAVAGILVPIFLSETILASTTVFVLFRASKHLSKIIFD
jgi:hypothetical protein